MTEISVVEVAETRDIRFLPADEKDLIFQSYAKDRIFNPVALGELRRLIDKPELTKDFGQGEQAQLHTAVELAAALDGINAMILPVIKLPRHEFGVVRRGATRKGSADQIVLLFTQPRLAYVDMPRPILMEVSTEIVVESVKVFGRKSKEFARHISVGGGKPARVYSIKLLGKELTNEEHKLGDWLNGFCMEMYKILNFSHDWVVAPIPTQEYMFKAAWPEQHIDENISKITSMAKRPQVDKLIAVVEMQHINLLAALFVKNPQSVIAKYTLRMERRAASAANKIASDAAAATRKLYEHIISDKFGKNALTRALSKANAAGTSDLLSVLPAGERKVVEAEKIALDKQLQAIRNNKCEHVRLLRNIDEAVGAQRTRLIAELGAFVGAVKQTEEIICKKCDLPLLCPHRYALLTASRDMSQFSVAVKGSTYCKLCGELLSLETEDTAPRMEMDEEIAELIWDEAIILTRLLDLPPAISFSKFIQNMRGDVYKYVAELFVTAAKSKTSTVKEVKARQRIYAAIYILAWFVKYALSGAISFRNIQLQKGKEAPTLLHHCIKSMLSIYSSKISTMQGMTAEILKTHIVQAYKTLIVSQYDVSTSTGTKDELTDFIVGNAMYGFLCQLEQMTIKEIPKDRPADRIDRLLSVDRTERAETKGAKKIVRVPVSIWKNAKSPRVKDAKHINQLWDHLLGMAHDRIQAVPVFINASSTRGRYASVTVVISEEHIKAAEKTAKLAAQEEEWRFEYRNLMRKPVQVPIGVSQRRLINDKPQSLSARYDENGSKHKWDIITIDGKDYTAAEYAKALPAQYPSAIKCAVCGVAAADADTIESEDKVREALQAKYTIENFFRFYAFRCPVSDVHETPKCGKCGWYADMPRDESKQYFAKYQATYAEQKKQEIPTEKKTLVTQVLPTAPEEWSFNFDIILELATKLNINHRQIAALGGYEREDLTTVQNGTYIAQEPDTRYSTRIFKLIGYLQAFVVEYNRLRNISKIPSPPKSLAIFAEQHITRALYKDLEELPALPADFLKRVEGTRREKKPKAAMEYILQIFCEELLRLLAVKGAIGIVATAFVKEFMRKTIAVEELLSKPGYFNWAVFYGKSTSDTVVQEDSGEIIEETDTGEDENTLSTKAFDVEERDDPDDPDDEPNMIRLEGID